MTLSVQDAVPPRIARVGRRLSPLKLPGMAAADLHPGGALALLGPPGVYLHRLAADVIRGLSEPVVAIWLNLDSLTERLALGLGDPSLLRPGGPWDKALHELLIGGLNRAMAASGIPDPVNTPAAAGTSPLAHLIHCARSLSGKGHAPVLVLRAMHHIPWEVSERFQEILRAALDNEGQPAILRILLTGSSDFLSGNAIQGDAADQGASPLYSRTIRYEVLPYANEQLVGLLPLPGDLPDKMLNHLAVASGGSIGVLDVLVQALRGDVRLGRTLYEFFEVCEQSAGNSWQWECVARLEGIGGPLRGLLREGLGALLSSPTGRSWPIVEALSALLDRGHTDDGGDSLLPLELAGIARPSSRGRTYHFFSPLIPVVLREVLPRNKSVRDSLAEFQRRFRWASPPSDDRRVLSGNAGASSWTSGRRLHVEAPIPRASKGDEQIDGKESLGEAGERAPLAWPPSVRELQENRDAQAVHELLDLLQSIAEAVYRGRSLGNQALVTISQLDIQRIDGRDDAMRESMADVAPSVVEPDGRRRSTMWRVLLSDRELDSATAFEAAAFFLPPDRMTDWLLARYTNRPFQPEESDDAYALGIMAGLLLGGEADPRRIVERIDNRLTGVSQVGVGQLLRLVRRCLRPLPQRRPSLQSIVHELDAVQKDPYGPGRRLLRHLTLFLMASTGVLGMIDWAYDAMVDNHNWIYSGIKVVGATALAAFYVLAWLIFGKTERTQVWRELYRFIKQRLNRLGWLLLPCVLSAVFAGIFAERLYFSRSVQLAPPTGYLIEEIKERPAGTRGCRAWRTFFRYAEPVSHSTLRMPLRAREYLILLQPEDGGPRRFRVWRAEDVRTQLDRGWGDTLHVDNLPQASRDVECIPGGEAEGADGRGTEADPADDGDPSSAR